MKRIYENWLVGWAYLFGDEHVSFYVFFTSIFAGCAWLYSHCKLSVSIPLSIVMCCYIVNIMIFSWLKGNAEGTRLEVIFSICYAIIFLTLLIIGLIINWKIHLIMMAIILAITAIAIWLRDVGIFTFLQGVIFSGLITIMSLWFAKIPTIPWVFHIIVPIVYLTLVPFIAYYEDSSGAQNIFELAFENTWDPEFEKRMRELDSKNIVV